MKMLPVRPVDMPLEQKKQKVADFENTLSAYRENPSLLLSDLKRMPPQRDNYTEGCFGPDVDGYDLCADSPLNQAVQCYDFGRPWKPRQNLSKGRLGSKASIRSPFYFATLTFPDSQF